MSDDDRSDEPAAAAGAAPGSKVLLAAPSDDEVAAIVAAVEVAWPKPTVVAADPAKPSRWRFSGRWWSAPIPMRRVRPW